MATVFVSQTAQEDLVAIWQYVAQSNEAAANRLIDRLSGLFEVYSKQPEAEELVPDIQAGLRRFSCGNCVVFYRPSNSGIVVVRVFYGARKISSLVDP